MVSKFFTEFDLTPYKLMVSFVLHAYTSARIRRNEPGAKPSQGKDENVLIHSTDDTKTGVEWSIDFATLNFLIDLITGEEMTTYRELWAGCVKFLRRDTWRLLQVRCAALFEEASHRDLSILDNFLKSVYDANKINNNQNSLIGVFIRKIAFRWRELSFSSQMKLYLDSWNWVMDERKMNEDGKYSEIWFLFHRSIEMKIPSKVTFPLRFRKEESKVDRLKNMSLRDDGDLEVDDANNEMTKLSSDKHSFIITEKDALDFIRQQLFFLRYNQNAAMSPKLLDAQITCILQKFPYLSYAYILRYVNSFERFRDFKACQMALHQYYDSIGYTGSPIQRFSLLERSLHDFQEIHRYHHWASLNMVSLHYQFGAIDQAKQVLHETISLAQHMGDTVCLQQCLLWIYLLREPIDFTSEDTNIPSIALNLHDIQSRLSLAQLSANFNFSHTAVDDNKINQRSSDNKNVFSSSLSKQFGGHHKRVTSLSSLMSELYNAAGSLPASLLSTHPAEYYHCLNLTHTFMAAYSGMFGNPIVEYFSSCMALNLNSRTSICPSFIFETFRCYEDKSKTQCLNDFSYNNTETECIAQTNMYNLAYFNGNVQEAKKILTHLKKRFPENLEFSKIWKFSEALNLFEYEFLLEENLQNMSYIKGQELVRSLSSFKHIEGQLANVKLSLKTRENLNETLKLLNELRDVLNTPRTNPGETPIQGISHKIQLYYLYGDYHSSLSNSSIIDDASKNGSVLHNDNENSFGYAIKYYLKGIELSEKFQLRQYLALGELKIVQSQYSMRLMGEALNQLKKSMTSILTTCNFIDCATARLLLAKLLIFDKMKDDIGDTFFGNNQIRSLLLEALRTFEMIEMKGKIEEISCLLSMLKRDV